MVGRLLHARSRRAERAVRCGQLRDDAAGPAGDRVVRHARPAATADSPRKIGTFEQAHGGTLFLDEVADMPLETQGKIVRALQEQTFERVGGSRRVEVDVRVIASTNRDLAAEIAAGRFREDLYYRLNVVPIRVPRAARAARGHPAAGAPFHGARRRGRRACTPREFGEDAHGGAAGL